MGEKMRKIYFNGDFITLEKETVEAILIDNGIIKKVGTKEEILNCKDENTELIDLNRKTMMPAFIDSHSHFFAVANNLHQVSLNDCTDHIKIQEKLKKYKIDNNIGKDKWIIANGYDNNNFKDTKHITKKEIDEILPDNPVVIHHQSGHSGILNSKALEIIGINEKTPDPAGGRIGKDKNELNGYLEENAFIENIKKIPMPTLDELIENANKAQLKYASYGITTVQEGCLVKELISIYDKLIKCNKIFLDIIAYIDLNSEKEIKEKLGYSIGKYEKGFKIAGYKIFLDGSPQARTAWMRTPYIDDNNYYGYGLMDDILVKKAICKAIDDNLQIIAHCNGDKAAEQFIMSIKNVGKLLAKKRPVLIHGQLLGIDQLKDIKELGIIPSFFISHIYYWGDVHVKNFGIERAKQISPAKSSIKENILFTLHQDSPVIEPNMFETIWCAVNRKTKKGEILGAKERIEVIDVIKAVTINAAYQYFEEDKKGSIKEGKIADLIIVSRNPLKIDKDDIKYIEVLETIKNGKTIYKV